LSRAIVTVAPIAAASACAFTMSGSRDHHEGHEEKHETTKGMKKSALSVAMPISEMRTKDLDSWRVPVQVFRSRLTDRHQRPSAARP
jgi:hypothetical protein